MKTLRHHILPVIRHDLPLGQRRPILQQSPQFRLCEQEHRLDELIRNSLQAFLQLFQLIRSSNDRRSPEGVFFIQLRPGQRAGLAVLTEKLRAAFQENEITAQFLQLGLKCRVGTEFIHIPVEVKKTMGLTALVVQFLLFIFNEDDLITQLILEKFPTLVYFPGILRYIRTLRPLLQAVQQGRRFTVNDFQLVPYGVSILFPGSCVRFQRRQCCLQLFPIRFVKTDVLLVVHQIRRQLCRFLLPDGLLQCRIPMDTIGEKFLFDLFLLLQQHADFALLGPRSLHSATAFLFTLLPLLLQAGSFIPFTDQLPLQELQLILYPLLRLHEPAMQPAGIFFEGCLQLLCLRVLFQLPQRLPLLFRPLAGLLQLTFHMGQQQILQTGSSPLPGLLRLAPVLPGGIRLRLQRIAVLFGLCHLTGFQRLLVFLQAVRDFLQLGIKEYLLLLPLPMGLPGLHIESLQLRIDLLHTLFGQILLMLDLRIAIQCRKDALHFLDPLLQAYLLLEMFPLLFKQLGKAIPPFLVVAAVTAAFLHRGQQQPVHQLIRGTAVFKICLDTTLDFIDSGNLSPLCRDDLEMLLQIFLVGLQCIAFREKLCGHGALRQPAKIRGHFFAGRRPLLASLLPGKGKCLQPVGGFGCILHGKLL